MKMDITGMVFLIISSAVLIVCLTIKFLQDRRKKEKQKEELEGCDTKVIKSNLKDL